MENQGFFESQRQTKGFMWAYLFLGLIAILGGIYSFTYRVGSVPSVLFGLSGEGLDNSNAVSPEDRIQQLAELKLQDSDQDGLNDFDETYTYDTSTYLVDTDSDGITDPIELQQGTDPTCPTGQECVTRTVVDTAASSTATDQNQNNVQNIAFLDENATDEQLKEELKKLGVPDDVIAQSSSQDLRDVYFTVAEEYQNAYGTTANTSTVSAQNNTNTDPYADLLLENNNSNSSLSQPQSVNELQNLSTEQIRSILLQGGISQEELDGIDDATLKQLYDQTFQEQLNQVNQ